MAAQPYESLTYRGQVGRLRALAREALPRFGISSAAHFELLNHGENATFRVEHDGGQLHVLRIHRMDYQTPENIRAELAWLTALRRDTDLGIPLPETGTDGAFVQRVAHPGVPGERSCVLLEWIPGRFSSDRAGRLYYERLGSLMGALHAHARTWKRLDSFERTAWDEHALLGDAPRWGSPYEAPGLSAAEVRLLDRGREKATAEILSVGKSADVYGLIHADLHQGNTLIQGDRLCAIDFDDCAEGWFLYDILVATTPMFRHPDYLRRRRWFLRTYREHVPLSDEMLEHTWAFYIARRICHLGWITSRCDNPRLADYVEGARKTTCMAIEEYLAR